MAISCGLKRLGGVVLSLALVAALSGCNPKLNKRQVTVSLAPNAQVTNFEVHVVGLSQVDDFKWQAFGPENVAKEYFFGNDEQMAKWRQPEIRTKKFEFSSSDPMTTSYVLKRTDPIWKQWESPLIYRVYVLAGLRGSSVPNRCQWIEVSPDVPGSKGNVAYQVGDAGLTQVQ